MKTNYMQQIKQANRDLVGMITLATGERVPAYKIEPVIKPKKEKEEVRPSVKFSLLKAHYNKRSVAIIKKLKSENTRLKSQLKISNIALTAVIATLFILKLIS